MYQWWIWHSNWDFHLAPASHIPLVCSVEAIPACIYIGVSRIKFILLMFSDVPLHVLVMSRDHSFALSVQSFPYQIDLFTTTPFLTLLTSRVWWEMGLRADTQGNGMKRYVAARFNQGMTQHWCTSQAPLSAKNRDVLQRTVTQKVQRWQHRPDGLSYTYHWVQLSMCVSCEVLLSR